jgi:hypothetical protein
MAQLPEKIDVSEIIVPGGAKIVAAKLNEIIDYLGELEGGNDATTT